MTTTLRKKATIAEQLLSLSNYNQVTTQQNLNNIYK